MAKNYFKRLSRFVCVAMASALFVGMPIETLANNSDASLYQSTFDITGKVVDVTGEPVIGATAIVKNTTRGAVTDIEGVYHITNVQATDSIEIAYFGYTTVVARAAEIMDIVLVESALAVDEVVVVGFGTQKKVNVTGAVSMIEGDAIESRPTKDVSSALQGLIPGLNFSVGSGGGEVSNEMSFNIRGTGTIGDSDDSPLVLIDGVEGNMNTVNPNDIASISVLKDASSASIYGSRAAFGVILITTKNGTSGKARINYSSNFRFNSPINLPKTVDSYTYALVMNTASNNDGAGDTYDADTVSRILAYQNGTLNTTGVVDTDGTSWKGYQYTNANTDWHDYFYRSMVMSHDQNLSITGGTENFDYYVSAQYTKQNGILVFRNEESMTRYNLTSRINAKLTDWLKLTITNKWNRTNYEQPTYLTYNSGTFYHSINNAKPNSPIYDDNGYLSETTSYSRMVEGGDTTKETDINVNQVRLVATPLKGWNITAEGSMKVTNYHTHQEILPVYSYDATGTPQEIEFIGGVTAAGYSKVTESTYSTDFYTFNLFSDYTKEINGHTFKVLGGFNTEYYDYRNMSIAAQDLVTPNLPTINTSNSFVESGIAAGYSAWATAGFFGRINYDYKGKYLVELNARYDGTSRFIEDVRWAVFPSASIGWNIAKEDFFEPARDIFSTLKLRASWGQLGNTNTNSFYPFYSTMTLGTSNSGWMYDGAKQNTASAPSLISTSLTWETVTSYEVGLDFALFRNRLTGSGGYFERITSDMIGPADDLPLTLGTDVPD
ncbi:MAG: SusC/RagA family TonB-linked outer membrane protein, partial [Rikenellaceae bacterium]